MMVMNRVQAEVEGGLSRIRIVLRNSEPSRVRSELATGTDINLMLARHGINPLSRPKIQYGDVDYDLDLQRAFSAVSSVEAGFARLPDDVRQHFGTVQNMMKAAARGEYAPFMKERGERLEKELREKKAVAHVDERRSVRALEKQLDQEEAFDELVKSGGVKAPKGSSRR